MQSERLALSMPDKGSHTDNVLIIVVYNKNALTMPTAHFLFFLVWNSANALQPCVEAVKGLRVEMMAKVYHVGVDLKRCKKLVFAPY